MVDHRVLLIEIDNAHRHLTEEVIMLLQVIDGDDHRPILIQTD